MTQKLYLGVALSALLVSGALAQQPSPGPQPSASPPAATQDKASAPPAAAQERTIAARVSPAWALRPGRRFPSIIAATGSIA